MNRHVLRTALPLTVAALLTALVIAEPSLAASDVGKNVGKEVKAWATGLILGVAAIVGIPVLFRRDVSGGLVLALLLVVVGGFVFAQSSVREVIRALWRAVGG